ncbi:MAG: Hsp70 family protein [Spirulinaceae cyanobacterium SM2_1_0]|nr:Hsp70 family protein [Spirulinaceae cyanobacterium SM2_1_0]
MAIAIDFGTSNTVISRWNAATQQAETVNLPGLAQLVGDSPPLVPSLLYLEDAQAGRVLVGQAVRDRGLDLANDRRCFRGFKRGIGAAVQGFLPTLDGQTLSFEQLGSWFLQTLLAAIAPTATEDSLILTVPVDSFEAYRLWLSQACQAFPADTVRLLDEPTAAALGYGTADRDLLLVVDFGGGTVDLSLVQLNASTQAMKTKPLGFILKWGANNLGDSPAQKIQTARVLAKAGQNLGGNDIDNWLVDYFAREQGLPKTSLLTRLAERLKLKLSVQPTATEVYFNDETLESYELALTRDRFQQLLTEQRFFDQLDDLMTAVLQRSRLQGIAVQDIDAVLLVGGTTQIPAVQDWVRRYFPAEKVRAEQPFTAIATGALQLAQGFEVKDFLYHSYGVRYWNRREQCHSWQPLVKAGQPYPMPEPVELVLGASVDNQPQIELIIGELGAETGATEVFFDGDRLVTRAVGSGQTAVQPLNDREGARALAELSPPGSPGRDRLKLQFWVDPERYLRVNVEDLLTQRALLEAAKVVQLS